MMNKIFASTRVWWLLGLALLGVWGIGNAAPPARNTTDYAATQTQVEAKMAASNAQCFASCTKIYRTSNGLKLVVLDQNGWVFTIKRFPLAPGTMLVGIGPQTRSTSAPVVMSYGSAPGGVQAHTSTVDSTTHTNTYPVIRNGMRYLIVITITYVYVNSPLVNVIVNRTEFPLGPVKAISPR